MNHAHQGHSVHMAHGQPESHDHRGGGQSLNALAWSATLHCLTGCAIGEVLGMVIGTALGWGCLLYTSPSPRDA